jgi:NhaP-type Na+/H+ or K+/H+ antiporter
VDPFITTVALVGIVIVVASLLSGAVERSGVPLVAVFLALGAVLGPAGLGVVNITLGSAALETLATLGLALVLFTDAVTMDTGEIRERRRLAWRMLGPGTLIPAVLIALAGWLLLDLSVPSAAILGASLASTDPVLLRSVLRSRALPAPTRIALRLESGMNDVVLLPIVVLSMLFVRSGGTVAGGDVVKNAVGLFLLGPAVGALVGWLGIVVLAHIRDRVGVRRDYESLYALGLAFSAYAGAEAVGGSGFLAAFAAGLMVSAQDVELCDCFLEYGGATAEMFLLLTFVAFGTSLIWTGVLVANARTLLFAIIALSVRTIVLFPVLTRVGVMGRDRRLIALFGPRGLSSLLLVLLPVFGGLPGAEHLFAITCLVVLISVVVHGGGIAMFLRARAAAERTPKPPVAPPGPPATPSAVSPTTAAAEPVTASPADRASPPILPVEDSADEKSTERIDIEELRSLWAKGEPVIVADARTERTYRADDIQAKGAVRLPPDDAVRAAAALGLAQHGTLVVYCA